MAEARDDAVEAGVLEGQRLRVALDPLDLHHRVGAPLARDREQPGEKSRPVTRAATFAAGMVALPVPQATSSTSMPGSMPALSTSTSPAVAILSATDV